MQSNELTPDQLTVLDYVTRGLSIVDAATEAKLRWANVIEWKRTLPAFQFALEEALECRALLNRERAQGLFYEAIQVLEKIMRDVTASPSLRLRAALAVVKMSNQRVEAKRKPQNTHNPAQPQPIRRPVEPGRNSICPCGSGVKFKRCCGNPVPGEAAEEATAA